MTARIRFMFFMIKSFPTIKYFELTINMKNSLIKFLVELNRYAVIIPKIIVYGKQKLLYNDLDGF